MATPSGSSRQGNRLDALCRSRLDPPAIARSGIDMGEADHELGEFAKF